jgi:hypothetical protein
MLEVPYWTKCSVYLYPSTFEQKTKSLIFFFYVRCPGQLTRTTTIPHSPLDTLQAQEQVRHRGGDRRVHRGSNPRQERNKSHDWPQQLELNFVWFKGCVVVIIVIVDTNAALSFMIIVILVVRNERCLI